MMVRNCMISMAKGFQLVCPVKRYKRTTEERLKLVEFYESALGTGRVSEE